jgi:hypothetical protein
MKRLAMLLFVLMMLGTFSFADQGEPDTQAPAAETAAGATKRDFSVRIDGAQFMQGTVADVTCFDFRNRGSSLVLRDSAGSPVLFSIKPSAAVYSANSGCFLSLRQVCIGDRVEIGYKAAGDVYQALSVKLMDK